MVAFLCLSVACGDGDDPQPASLERPEPAVEPRDEEWAYAFPFFRGEGTDGIYLAVSTDGQRFVEVNDGEPVLTSPFSGTRDPSLLLGPDDRWHLAFTSGNPRSVGLAHSDDLLEWSEPVPVEVMADEPTAINSWAPELLWDAEAEEYVIVFASTVRRLHPTGTSEPGPDGQAFEHRLYTSRSTDLEAWSSGELFWDGDVNAIDGVVAENGQGGFILAYKDERLVPEVRKRVAVARADAFTGPWNAGTTVTELGSWVEGPSLVRSLDGDGWLLFADRYYGDGYGAVSSTDLETWTDVSADVTMPAGVRHGTVLRVPLDRVEPLLDTAVEPSDEGPPPGPTVTLPETERAPVDPAGYGTDRPTGAVGGVLFDVLTAQGVAPNVAVCTAEVLASRVSDGDLIAAGIVELTDEALTPVIGAALDCGIPQATIDATVAAARGGG